MEIQWPLAVFTLLTGCAGWLFFFTGLNEFTRKSEKSGFVPGVVAIVLLAVGSFASVLHLSHPFRMLNALSHPTSGIFIEFVLVILLGCSILVYLILLKRNVAGTPLKVLAVCGMVFGVLISFMAGESYIMEGRAAWQTMLLPMGYLGTAIPSGAALYWVLASGAGEQSDKASGVAVLVGGVVALVTALAYALVSGSLALGAGVYVGVTVVLSGAAPIACGILARVRTSGLKPLAAIALICALLGGLSYRVMMWVVGSGAFNFFSNM